MKLSEAREKLVDLGMAVGESDADIMRAILIYQRDHADLPDTGEFDAATIKHLNRTHKANPPDPAPEDDGA